MHAAELVEKLKSLAGITAADDSADSLIGVFQAFRPRGDQLGGVFDAYTGGSEFHRRLLQVYRATADSERADSLRDAYFVIRNPPQIGAEAAQEIAEAFLNSMREVAEACDDASCRELLRMVPQVRVLEGKPPKQLKSAEQCRLHQTLRVALPQLIHDRYFAAQSVATMLRPACYFIACDPWLRDYLLWPLLDDAHTALDPLRAYFELWRHGVKLRMFNDESVDVYLPFRSDGSLIDAGQFAR